MTEKDLLIQEQRAKIRKLEAENAKLHCILDEIVKKYKLCIACLHHGDDCIPRDTLGNCHPEWRGLE